LKRWEYGDAWNTGYKAGEGLDNAIANFDPASLFGSNIPSPDDYANNGSLAGSTPISGGVANNIANTAANTGAMRDSMSASEEDMKYLRDIAERETINRFTTAEVKVDFGGITNHVNSSMDLDGVVNFINDGVREALGITAEGAYA